MNSEHDDALMKDAARLTTEITPEKDLWPAIETAITAPPEKRWAPYFAQAAAVVLLVAASSIITFMLTNDGPDVSPGTAASVPIGNLETKFVVGDHSVELGQSFQIARGNLQAQLDRELGRLSPDARVSVEQNLQVIREAIAEINTALEQEPDNSLLQDLLLKSYRQEIALMRKVGGLTQSVMSRNDI